MDKKLDTICPAVWDHLCINTRGMNRLCCNSITQKDDRFLDKFDEHWNDLRNKVKKEMLAGGRPNICKVCWDKEDLGISSLRNNILDKYHTSGKWKTLVENLDTVRETPTELDLKLGNYCNLSCRMCNSYSSSGYANELKKIYKETGVDLSKNENELSYVQDKWYDNPIVVERIKHYIDNGLLELKFTGGEPMMVPGVKEVINYCTKTDKAKNIQIQLITNGTLLNKEWLELLTQFDMTVLTISIDGVGDTYEYIRHPTNWQEIYKKLRSTVPYIEYRFRTELTFTLQVYNMLEIENMINLRRELKASMNSIPLFEPAFLDVRNAPEDLKADAIKIIDSIDPQEKQEQRFLSDVKGKILQKPSLDIEETKQTVMKHSLAKDPFRNQDFTKQAVYKYYG
jgi:sulfatase maturation enzyme AslB (radical SAM superfamily)